MKNFSEKQIVEQIKKKNFDHDIQFIEGKFVEDVVREYQETGDESLIQKIIMNYRIFRRGWAKVFAPYCDGDQEAGELLHDEIIWKSATKFDGTKAQKQKGKAFNAFYVSACLNKIKNDKSAKESHKNYPRVTCPACKEQVYQIDAKHLRHVMDLERYKRTYPKYPLVSIAGKVSCPANGQEAVEITDQYLNRIAGYYTEADFKAEFASLLPRAPLTCPVTGIEIRTMTANYPQTIMRGCTEEDFISSFPEFPGIIHCPFSGEKLLEITQKHLDRVLKQKPGERHTLAKFCGEYPNATIKARQAQVLNPYTNKMVDEITPEMIREAGTTIREHLEKYAQICLEQWYQIVVTCPFTGRKTHRVTKEYLCSLGKTVYDFYHAVCKYPMRKFLVRCAHCGEFVPNIWGHLETAGHTYAQGLSVEDLERTYGVCPTKAIISTNSFYVNESGDSIHVADLFPKKTEAFDLLEIEDSLLHVAEDEMDRRIAAAIRCSWTLEDICFAAAEKSNVPLPASFAPEKTRLLKEAVRKSACIDDFDFVIPPKAGDKTVEIMTPSRESMRLRLTRMIEASDLITA
jgi:hypothetical protein